MLYDTGPGHESTYSDPGTASVSILVLPVSTNERTAISTIEIVVRP
jgi:hypothetical protein